MRNKKKLASAVLSVMLAASLTLGSLPIPGTVVEAAGTSSEQRGYDPDVTNTYTPVAGGTIYYVDSKEGNDSNPGTAENQAFQTLGRVNRIELKAGDSILLKRGSVFEKQHLAPVGKGTEAKHILIGAYGEGNMPVINARREYREAILIENMEYVDVTGIEVTNDDVFNMTTSASDPNNHKDDKVRSLGVHITINEGAEGSVIKSESAAKSFGSVVPTEAKREWKGINIDGLYIHDVDGDENCDNNKLSGGIGVEVIFYDSNGVRPYFNGVTLQNNRIRAVDRCGIKGIRLSEYNNGTSEGVRVYRENNVRKTDGTNQVALNYVVKNNYLSDIGGDGILMDSCKGGLCENNLLYNHTMRARGANAGIWSWNTFDCLFRYNESYGGPMYNQDGCSYDSDFLSAGTIFEYNYSHDCVMGFMLLMGQNSTDIVRYNLSQNDGNVWRHLIGSPTPSYIYNNVFYYNGDDWRFVNNGTGDDATASITSNWNFYNNIFYNTSKTKTSTWKINDWQNAGTKTNLVYEASGVYADNEIAGAIHADPMFVDGGKGATRAGTDKNAAQGNIWTSLNCYQLQANSPAIGTGSYVDVVSTAKNAADRNVWEVNKDRNATKDFYGNSLYYGAPDIGLHEYPGTSSFTLEPNAIYSLIHSATHKYISLTPGSASVSTKAEGTDQSFMLIESGSGYKLRIWDSSISAYRYLAVSGNTAQLSDTEQTIWTTDNLNNGLYRLKYNGSYLTADANGNLTMTSQTDAAAQWYLQKTEDSHSYNTNGEKLEGFSADQLYDESQKQSGFYGEGAVGFTTSKDGVYATGRKGTSVGYKMYASNGEYTVRLYLAEPESLSKKRTMDIVANGKERKSGFVLDKETKEVILNGVYVQDGILDVKLVSTYNEDFNETEAVLCGISAEKMTEKEMECRINAGGGAGDGLSADVEYTDANGAGYDGTSTAVSLNSIDNSADAGFGGSMKQGREGADFGYKVKASPGTYRVKLYFAESTQDVHIFDVTINGTKVKENYKIAEQAGGVNKSTGFTFVTEPDENGLIDIHFQGVNGKKAMVNAVIVEKYDQPEGTSANIVSVQANSEQTGREAAKATDKNHGTRWASTAGNNNAGQTITFELDGNYLINGVVLDWTPNARAESYHIDLSEDGETYHTADTVIQSKAGLNVHTFDAETAKYVKVVCDKKLNQFATSITEAEIFVGAKVEGTAKAQAVAEKAAEKFCTKVTAGMGYIYKKYSTMTVEYSFDEGKVQYVENSAQYLSQDKLKKTVALSVEPGKVTQRFGMMKWDGFFAGNTDVMSAVFKNLTNVPIPVRVKISFTNSAGHVIELPEEAVLLAEGSGEVEASTSGYFKDYIVDSTTGHAGTQVADGVLKVTANGTGSNANNINTSVDEAATELDSGTFFARFKVKSSGTMSAATNGKDQVIFDIKRVDENKMIRIGFDYTSLGSSTGNWFYGKSSSGQGWGNFPKGTGVPALTEDEEHTIQVDFTKTAEDRYTIKLTVDGTDMGTVKDVAYDDTPGKYGFSARRVTKEYTLNEVYYGTGEPYQIKVTAGEHGTVSQTGDVTAFYGAKKTLVVKPEDGYMVEKVLVNGEKATLKDNKYVFQYVAGEQTFDVTFCDESAIMKGDVNGDKVVDLLDLRIILRHICGKLSTGLSEQQLRAGDVAGDDGIINLLDLRKILRYICKKIPEL